MFTVLKLIKTLYALSGDSVDGPNHLFGEPPNVIIFVYVCLAVTFLSKEKSCSLLPGMTEPWLLGLHESRANGADNRLST